jgi:hypothetical protein
MIEAVLEYFQSFGLLFLAAVAIVYYLERDSE